MKVEDRNEFRKLSSFEVNKCQDIAIKHELNEEEPIRLSFKSLHSLFDIDKVEGSAKIS